MKILGLPGIKPATEQWMTQLLGSLDLGQSETIIQQYQYWSKPGAGLDMSTEANIATGAKPDIVVAKSVGTRVALHACMNGMLTADKYIFIGLPLRSFTHDEMNALEDLCRSCDVLLIQQSNDPVCSYGELAASIPDTSFCRKIEIAGNDHMYADIMRLKQLIESSEQKP